MITKQTAKELTEEEIRLVHNEYNRRYRNKNKSKVRIWNTKYRKRTSHKEKNTSHNKREPLKVKPIELIDKQTKDKQIGDIFKWKH